MLMPNLIESDAFMNLSGKAAIVALIRFHQKAYRKGPKNKRTARRDTTIITNNGQIVFTYAEAKELGIRSSQTFHKVIRELVEDKGFIDITEPGNWYQQQPSKYAISERWKKYGTSDFKRKEVPRGLPDGVGFKKQNSL